MISSKSELSSKLDELIEFAEYPKGVIESTWKRLKKASPGTVDKIRRRYGNIAKKHEEEQFPWMLRYYKYRKAGGTSAFPSTLDQFSIRLDDLVQFADPRPRNNLGEFSPQGEGGPDPNAMYKTYIIAPQAPGMAPNKGSGLAGTAAGAAGLTVLGGAGGALGGHLAKSGLDKIGEALKKARKIR